MKYMDLSADEVEELNRVAKALSSPVRVEIIKLLYRYSLNINEIATRLGIPASSAAMHIRVLEEADLINTESHPGERGNMKLCSRKRDFITIRLRHSSEDVYSTRSVSMPVGAYTDCEIVPTCGIATAKGVIGNEDVVSSFYLPERINAGIVWTSRGFFEYRFPNTLPRGKKAVSLSLSMEICSEAPNYQNDWKSDITLWINDVDCGKWTSPGDFGGNLGVLNPSWWPHGATQYGLLNNWIVNGSGTFVNSQQISDKTIENLEIDRQEFIKVRIGNKRDAEYVGGLNLFGKSFGNFPQDIVMSLQY